MKDSEGVAFLQWAFPKLRMRWPGFRKVRRQVFKRIDRRLRELGIPDVSGYRSYLETHAEEWQILDRFCWISISRFYRDRAVFQYLETTVLPELAANVDDQVLRCWSVGCGGGEEPYTLAIMWGIALAPRFPGVRMCIVGTDVDPHSLTRANSACYSASSLKDLPEEWQKLAFIPTSGGSVLKSEYRDLVAFCEEDIRLTAPLGGFHLILCRYLAFTYFNEPLQQETLLKLREHLLPGGALVIGSTESFPADVSGFETWSHRCRVYRKSLPSSPTSVTSSH